MAWPRVGAASGRAAMTLAGGSIPRCYTRFWIGTRKHPRVVRSTCAAELLSLLDAVGQGNLIATAIDEVQHGAATARQHQERQDECHISVWHEVAVDAKAVFDGVTAEQPKTPAEKPLFLHALAVREHLEAGHLSRLWWFDTRAMLPDGFTKGSVDREALVSVCEQGVWRIVGDTPVCKRRKDEDKGAGH